MTPAGVFSLCQSCGAGPRVFKTVEYDLRDSMYVSPFRVSVLLRAAHPVLRTQSADTTTAEIEESSFMIVGVNRAEGAKLE